MVTLLWYGNLVFFLLSSFSSPLAVFLGCRRVAAAGWLSFSAAAGWQRAAAGLLLHSLLLLLLLLW